MLQPEHDPNPLTTGRNDDVRLNEKTAGHSWDGNEPRVLDEVTKHALDVAPVLSRLMKKLLARR